MKNFKIILADNRLYAGERFLRQQILKGKLKRYGFYSHAREYNK
jgi:hypothetical protein